MSVRALVFAAVATTTGCAVTEPAVAADDGDAFEFEPGLLVPLTWDAGKADLPNSAFVARPLDTAGYLAIARSFVIAGHDVSPTTAERAFDWPLAPADRTAVLNRAGTPIRLAQYVYEHTGLDIIRRHDAASTDVVAPVGGIALVTDWDGAQALTGSYQTVVSIWDPTTHLIVQLMHVAPAAGLPRGEFFTIERGQLIGTLAVIARIPGGEHVHVNVVDASAMRLVDPAIAFPAYQDTTAPTIQHVYLLDAQAGRSDSLTTGPLDVVVEVADRDAHSRRNLEPARIAYVARDQAGTVLGQVEACALSDAFSDLQVEALTATIRLLDFGNAEAQFGGFWPASDLGNPDRTFRYAVTNLRHEGTRCAVVEDDRLGAIEVTDAVTAVELTIDVWDARGNRATQTRTLTR